MDLDPTQNSMFRSGLRSNVSSMNQESWVNFKFVVIGKGETAGRPIISGLKKMGIEPQIIDTKTKNLDEILKNADVIISCVGKSGVVSAKIIKKGVILIGVGTHGEYLPAGRHLRGFRGDYKVEDIEKIAGAYTPTPGAVGPVNLFY